MYLITYPCPNPNVSKRGPRYEITKINKMQSPIMKFILCHFHGNNNKRTQNNKYIISSHQSKLSSVKQFQNPYCAATSGGFTKSHQCFMIGARISNHNHCFVRNVITHPCHNITQSYIDVISYPCVNPDAGFAKRLTHCGLVMPYGDIGLGQHWLI